MDGKSEMKKLVNLFNKNYEEYKKESYNETSCREEFINHFLEILGWDVTNSNT